MKMTVTLMPIVQWSLTLTVKSIYLMLPSQKLINLTRNPEFVKEWIDDILWMNIVEFEEVDIDQK